MSNCDNSLQWLYDWEYNSDGFKNYQDLPLYIENCFKKKREPYKCKVIKVVKNVEIQTGKITYI